MNELHKLHVMLGRQHRRLKDLIEICGGLDPSHPLQAYSIRRIEYLEKQIEQAKETAP